MSTVSSAADLWVDDLEDLLGLHPIRPQPEPDYKRRTKRRLAFLGALCVAVSAVGLTAIVVGLNRDGLSTSGIQESVERPGSAARRLPVRSSSPYRTAQTAVSIDPEAGSSFRSPADSGKSTQRDLDSSTPHARTADSESLAKSLPDQLKVQATVRAPALPSDERSPLLSAGGEETASVDASTLPPAPKYISDEVPAAGISPRASPSLVAGSPPDRSSDGTFTQEGSETRRSIASRKTKSELEAIDALRTLRRQ